MLTLTPEEVIQYFITKGNNSSDQQIKYCQETNTIIEKSTGKIIGNLDDYLRVFRKISGISFDCIHDEHVFCWSILKCTECGTLVKYSYDSSDYDDEFRCPTCTGYETWFKYWKPDDPDYDDALSTFIEMNRILVEMNERIKRRKGKRDSILTEFKNINPLTKRNRWDLDIEIDNITNRWPLSGLRLRFQCWERQEDGISLHWKKDIRIPLSWSAFYIQCIYPKTKAFKRF